MSGMQGGDAVNIVHGRSICQSKDEKYRYRLQGWMSWEHFRCETNCTRYPDACISERLIKETTDVIASGGFRDAGYQYVIVDDCWLARSRDASGHLQPDPARFPSGIRDLASYVQSR